MTLEEFNKIKIDDILAFTGNDRGRSSIGEVTHVIQGFRIDMSILGKYNTGQSIYIEDCHLLYDMNDMIDDLNAQ